MCALYARVLVPPNLYIYTYGYDIQYVLLRVYQSIRQSKSIKIKILTQPHTVHAGTKQTHTHGPGARLAARRIADPSATSTSSLFYDYTYLLRAYRAIKSKILTKPNTDTGKKKPIPAPPQRVAHPLLCREATHSRVHAVIPDPANSSVATPPQGLARGYPAASAGCNLYPCMHPKPRDSRCLS